MVEKALHRAVCRQPLARLPSSSNPKDQRYLPKYPPQLWLAAVALNPSPGPQPARPAPPPARTPGFPPPLHTGPGTACCRRHPSSPASLRLGQPQSAAQKGTRQETARIVPEPATAAPRGEAPAPAAGLQLPACLAAPRRLHLVRRRRGRASALLPLTKRRRMRYFKQKLHDRGAFCSVFFLSLQLKYLVEKPLALMIRWGALWQGVPDGRPGSPLPGRVVSLRSCKTAFLPWKRCSVLGIFSKYAAGQLISWLSDVGTSPAGGGSQPSPCSPLLGIWDIEPSQSPAAFHSFL